MEPKGTLRREAQPTRADPAAGRTGHPTHSGLSLRRGALRKTKCRTDDGPAEAAGVCGRLSEMGNGPQLKAAGETKEDCAAARRPSGAFARKTPHERLPHLSPWKTKTPILRSNSDPDRLPAARGGMHRAPVRSRLTASRSPPESCHSRRWTATQDRPAAPRSVRAASTTSPEGETAHGTRRSASTATKADVPRMRTTTSGSKAGRILSSPSTIVVCQRNCTVDCSRRCRRTPETLRTWFSGLFVRSDQ